MQHLHHVKYSYFSINITNRVNIVKVFLRCFNHIQHFKHTVVEASCISYITQVGKGRNSTFIEKYRALILDTKVTT